MNVLNDKISLVFYVLIPLLVVGISYGFTTFPICLVVIILRLFTTNKDTVAFYLMMFGGPIIGFTRIHYPYIPIYGIFALFMSIILAREYISSFFNESISSIQYMITVFLVFIISYLYAEPTSYANTKLVELVKHGSIMLFAFFIYAKSTKISNEHLAQLSLITVLIYITHTILTCKLSVGTMFDYDWYRNQLSYVSRVYGIESEVGYQTVGMTSLLGLCFILSKVEIKKVILLFYFIISFHLVMFSGARQAILGLLVIFFFRFAYFNKNKGFIRILLFILIALVTYLLVSLINSIGSVHVEAVDAGGNGRDIIYLKALDLIYKFPLFGVGLGGYEYYNTTLSKYPHNVILEIICETGFIGFFIIVVIVVLFFTRNKLNFKTLTKSSNYYFLIILALAVRYMISSDLTNSIELFSAVFALATINQLIK